MKIKCNKSDLLHGVNTVLKAVATRTTLPILECILINANHTELTLVSNDLDLGIKSTVKALILKQGSVALDAKILSEIVKKLPNSQVLISVDDNNLVTINCEKSEFKISGQPSSEFIDLPLIQKENCIKLSQNQLKEMIRQTLFSIAIDETRPIFTGELFEIKDKIFNIVSLDGHRISIRKTILDNEYSDIRVVIPGKTLSEINKLLSNEDEIVNIFISDNHILFEFDNSIVLSRLLEGEFPKYEQIFSKDYEISVKVNKKEILMSIERASLISREGKRTPIKISIKQESIIITSNTELGTAYEEINVLKNGKELDIAFNPKFLIDVLRVIDDEEIEIRFTNASSPCIIQQIDGEDYKYLILPIRINE